jgi:PTH1 family peptidyl-tRNA hydrolase
MQAQLGSADFWRLRLGIGHPGVKAEVVNYVLKKPSPTDRETILQSIDKSLQVLDLLLAADMERATMKLNARPPRPKPPRPAGPPAAGNDNPGGTGA